MMYDFNKVDLPKRGEMTIWGITRASNAPHVTEICGDIDDGNTSTYM